MSPTPNEPAGEAGEAVDRDPAASASSAAWVAEREGLRGVSLLRRSNFLAALFFFFPEAVAAREAAFSSSARSSAWACSEASALACSVLFGGGGRSVEKYPGFVMLCYGCICKCLNTCWFKTSTCSLFINWVPACQLWLQKAGLSELISLQLAVQVSKVSRH